ncbi:hypothetical protein ACJDU8_24070 [Clostridium sp. WILCCON 0269]|uniref:DUF2680 domain-containing protein n=1 Tax=Candidatus Clostridium eludens TaxID=3381663 RepID=A0ABW8SUC0_9CLOT
MIKMKYKLISAVMLAAPLLANTGIATTVHACANTQPISYSQTRYSFTSFQAKLDSLVKAGVISKAQEKSILAQYYNGKIGSRANLDAQLDALISSGVIPHSKKAPILNGFTGWGSNWYISVPNSGGHNTPTPINHNTPQPNATNPDKNNSKPSGSKTNASVPGGNKQNVSKPSDSKQNVSKTNTSKPSDSKQNNPKVNTPAAVTPPSTSTNNCGK